MNKILLLGAGFSRNWGCWLAPELMGDLLGRVAKNRELHKTLRGSKGFEAALASVQARYQTMQSVNAKRDLDDLQAAIRESFMSMNRSLLLQGGMEFPVNNGEGLDEPIRRGIGAFLAKFDSIFTLNQDLLLEMHYAPLFESGDPRMGKTFPGLIKPENPLASYDFAEKWTVTDRFEIEENKQPIFKLHGSVNWQQSGGGDLLIMGEGKSEAISKSPILRWYAEEFRRRLGQPNTRIMVIGYGFADVHVNDEIVRAGRQGLQMFLVNPEGTTVFDKPCDQQQIGRPPPSELHKVTLIGESRRSLSTTFGGDELERGKLLRFFEV